MASAVSNTSARAKRREGGALFAAALANGPTELVDFVLPLWAGLALGLSPTAVGVLVAVEMAVSVVVRPVAGVLADTRERRLVAALGALLYAVACAGYAEAEVAAVAFGAAALSGVGGALLWVSLRAIVSERLADDSAVYPRLMAARENGSWIAFVAGLMLLDVIGFPGVFLGCAAACALAAVVLLASPGRRPRHGAHAGSDAGALGLGDVGRRLRPMLAAVAFTMTAEAAVSMLLLLHLQRGLGLEVVQIAYVFLPGAIAMGVLPEHLHAVVVRRGRTTVLAMASVASATFALTLAWTPNPLAIAVLWILSGVAWAAVMPVQEAVVAEASGERVGRGMGLYEGAALVGGAVGTLGAGILYDHSSWTTACVVAAVVILAGAVVMPRAVRRLGVDDFPPPPPPSRVIADVDADLADGHGAPVEAPAGRHPSGPPTNEARSAPTTPRDTMVATGPPLVAPPVATADARGAPRRPRTVRDLLLELGAHALLFAAAQVVLVVVGASWIAEVAADPHLLSTWGGSTDLDGVRSFAHGFGRIWAMVLLVDVVVKLAQVARTRRRAR